MKYVKAGKQSVITRLLQQLSEISTAPARTYPLPKEHLGLPSLQAASLSITVLSPSRLYMLPKSKIQPVFSFSGQCTSPPPFPSMFPITA
jgi:hypothetical protein